MKSNTCGLLAGLLTGSVLVSPASAADADCNHNYAGDQQLGIPAYVHPLRDPAAWDRVIGSAPSKVGIIVANVLNGPDYQPKDYWTSVIHRAHTAGMRALGYVDTGYFGTTGQPTRLGSTSPEDWMAQIEQDIAGWYAFYGADIDGIFFDQGQNACGPTAGSETWVDLYRFINRYEKENHPGVLTVINPGTVVPECYEDAADVLLTFEGSYAAYVGRAPNPALDYQPLGWTPSDPYKIWHLVYGASQDELASAIELSRSRGAGYVYVTDDVLENPYDSVPASPYWDPEQALVAGGPLAPVSILLPVPYSKKTPSVPANLIAFQADYTSTQLEWGESTPNWAIFGYDVYANGSKILTLPSSTNKVRVGGLAPASTTTFTVQARAVSGKTSAPSNDVTVTTLPLPGGLSLTEPTATRTPTEITYSANFLLPFAFHRVFIATGDASHACFSTGSVPQYCADYVIENSKLLRYTGTGGDWTWEKVRAVVPVVDGYNYTWTISPGDIGSPSDEGTVFNAEGYAPLTYATPDQI
ncbi:MAG: spherulation-specific family 4 protein [Gammaproteobacteria bacterium]